MEHNAVTINAERMSGNGPKRRLFDQRPKTAIGGKQVSDDERFALQAGRIYVWISIRVMARDFGNTDAERQQPGVECPVTCDKISGGRACQVHGAFFEHTANDLESGFAV